MVGRTICDPLKSKSNIVESLTIDTNGAPFGGSATASWRALLRTIDPIERILLFPLSRAMTTLRGPA